MRLIDADALIESIKAQAGMLNWMLPEADEITDILSNGFIEQVNRMPTVPQWIPMSEREPEFGNYLTTFREKETGKVDAARDLYWSGGWDDDGDKLETIAGMPLPEPYKEGER